MNGDERFDQVLRSALEWQADETARQAPSLERSVRRVAERLGPEAQRVGPIVVGRSASDRGVQLVFALLLLLVLLAAALAIGSQFLFRPGIEPPRFGYEAECITPQAEGIVYSIAVGDTPLVLYDDGRLIKLLSAAGEARSAILDTAGGLERRVSPRGRELIFQRVAETVPEPGCRHLRADEAVGQIEIFTPDGPVELSWHPSNSGRRLTPDEEAEAEALEHALAQPETWLPDEAWLDPEERHVTPDGWLTFVELTPSGFGPGDEITTSTGDVLQGSDPRYGQVAMPDGQEPAAFGEEVTVRDGTRVRCGVLGTDDARRLSDSLDALGLPTDPEVELYTDDLTSRVFIYIATAYPEEPDCAAAARAQVGPEPTPTPAPPTPGPDDDLAGVDPCGLVPTSVDAMFGDDVTREEGRSFVPLGAPARQCSLVTATEFGPGTRHISVTLYPRSVDAESATALASSVLGGGLVAETIAGQPAWANDCLAEALPCRGAIAAWSDPYFMVVEFDSELGGGPPTTTVETARAVVEAVLAGLAE